MADFHDSDLTLPTSKESEGGVMASTELGAYTDPYAVDTNSIGVSVEEEIVVSKQPIGDGVTDKDEGDEDDGPTSSAENLLPKDKLENGFRHARMLLSSGWTSFASTVRDMERSETMGKIKQGSVTALDASMDGLSKVGVKVAALTDHSVKVLGEKLETAKPVVDRWRDNVVEAGEKGMEVVVEKGQKGLVMAKEVSQKGIQEIKKRSGGDEGKGEDATGDTGAHTV